MISRTVGALMPDGRERYLALEPDGEGSWIQIGNTFLDTSDEAGKLCILNLKRQVAELFEHVAMTRRRMLMAIDRLHDRPRVLLQSERDSSNHMLQRRQRQDE